MTKRIPANEHSQNDPLILQRPESFPEAASWLEKIFKSEKLGDLIRELRAVAQPDAKLPTALTEDEKQSVAQAGLAALGEKRFWHLFRMPEEILELQVHVLTYGHGQDGRQDKYWDGVPFSSAIEEATGRHWKNLQAALGFTEPQRQDPNGQNTKPPEPKP